MTDLDIREQLTRIDNAIAETHKFQYESGKLYSEMHKLGAETGKLTTERKWFVWVQFLSSSVLGGVIAALIAHFFK